MIDEERASASSTTRKLAGQLTRLPRATMAVAGRRRRCVEHVGRRGRGGDGDRRVRARLRSGSALDDAGPRAELVGVTVGRSDLSGWLLAQAAWRLVVITVTTCADLPRPVLLARAGTTWVAHSPRPRRLDGGIDRLEPALTQHVPVIVPLGAPGRASAQRAETSGGRLSPPLRTPPGARERRDGSRSRSTSSSSAYVPRARPGPGPNTPRGRRLGEPLSPSSLLVGAEKMATASPPAAGADLFHEPRTARPSTPRGSRRARRSRTPSPLVQLPGRPRPAQHEDVEHELGAAEAMPVDKLPDLRCFPRHSRASSRGGRAAAAPRDLALVAGDDRVAVRRLVAREAQGVQEVETVGVGALLLEEEGQHAESRRGWRPRARRCCVQDVPIRDSYPSPTAGWPDPGVGGPRRGRSDGSRRRPPASHCSWT